MCDCLIRQLDARWMLRSTPHSTPLQAYTVQVMRSTRAGATMRRSRRATEARTLLSVVPVAHEATAHRLAQAPRAAFDSRLHAAATQSRCPAAAVAAAAVAGLAHALAHVSKSEISHCTHKREARTHEWIMCWEKCRGERGRCAYCVRVAVTPRACTGRRRAGRRHTMHSRLLSTNVLPCICAPNV